MNAIDRVIIRGAYLLILFANITGASAETFIAKASWRLFDNNILEYSGTGDSKGSALEDARTSCVNRQVSTEWKAYCYQAPLRVVFQKIERCESRWTTCIGWGSAVGNPCDAGCYRGDQIEENVKPLCTEHRFECFRDVENPSIFLDKRPGSTLTK